MTMASSKGLTVKAAIIVGVEEGVVPLAERDPGEERRLLYVAMTRAKDHLALVMPQRFYTHGQPQRGDRHVYAAPTRFIPAAIIDRFEVTRWPVLQRGAAGVRGAAPDVRVDLRARLRGMWK